MTNQVIKRKTNKADADKVFMFFVHLILILIIIVIIYPLYFTIIASISDPVDVTMGNVVFFPKNLNFSGYEKLLSYKPIWRGYAYTILYTTLGTLINLLVLIPAAYALSRKDLVGRHWIMLYFVFVMYFTGGIVTNYILITKLNLINKIWSIVLPGALNCFNLIIARTFYQSSVPDELLDASRIDGATNTQFFARCVLPISKAIIAVMVLRHAIVHWNSYFQAYLYLRDMQKWPLQLVLRNILLLDKYAEYSTAAEQESYEYMMKLGQMIKYCIIFVSSAPMLALYPFVQKYFVKGMLIGSVKG